MIISLTPQQFNKYWYFLRLQVPIEKRVEVLKIYSQYKHLVDERTDLEIVVAKGN